MSCGLLRHPRRPVLGTTVTASVKIVFPLCRFSGCGAAGLYSLGRQIPCDSAQPIIDNIANSADTARFLMAR
jgi:hypothetical protein